MAVQASRDSSLGAMSVNIQVNGLDEAREKVEALTASVQEASAAVAALAGSAAPIENLRTAARSTRLSMSTYIDIMHEVREACLKRGLTVEEFAAGMRAIGEVSPTAKALVDRAIFLERE